MRGARSWFFSASPRLLQIGCLMFLSVKNNLISIYLQAKARHEAWRALATPDVPPILVYQMGKVGSSTVYDSLVNRSLPNSILHIHFLSDSLPEYKSAHEQAGVFPAPYHLLLGEALRKMLGKKRDAPVKIISLVRDPVAVVISSLFENTYFNKTLCQADSADIDPQKAIDHLHIYFQAPDCFRYIDEWFDRELKSVFDIDVFTVPFPVEKGYATYRNKGVEALVIRLEDLTEKGPEAIAGFLGLDDPLDMQQKNVRAEVRQSDSYKSVLKSICLGQDLCREIYSSRFVKHFYSDEMIAGFISRWCKSEAKDVV